MIPIRPGGMVCQRKESLILLVLITMAAAANAQFISTNGGERQLSVSDNITKILNELVDPNGPKRYDKRLRPKYGGEPVDVGITIHVSSISAVSEVEMDYTLDIYLRQMWTDPRLRFEGIDGNLTIGVHYMKSIWVPDTFFPNEKKSFFHEATTHNSFLRITPQGAVLTSQRLTVTATCPMNLHLFPLDSQECTLEIESYGYTTSDTRYCWEKKGDKYRDSVSKEDSIHLPQFLILEHIVTQKTQVLSSGNYSRLSCKFIFSRQIGFYVIQIYLPSTLIVIISWVSFWLSRDATPARVALGVTTVLTMTTLMTTTNAAMPKVSYIKSIDLYLGTCFLMVFASLLEYAVVGYLNKHLRMKRERKTRQSMAGVSSAATSSAMFPLETQKKPLASALASSPRAVDPTGAVSFGGTPIGLRARGRVNAVSSVTPMRLTGGGSLMHLGGDNAYSANTTLHMAPSTNSIGPLHRGYPIPPTSMASLIGSQSRLECDCDIDNHSLGGGGSSPNPLINPLKLTKPKTNHRYTGVTPSGIDKYSRIIFPVLFIIFNIMYWCISTYLSDQLIQNYIQRAFGDSIDPATDDCFTNEAKKLEIKIEQAAEAQALLDDA